MRVPQVSLLRPGIPPRECQKTTLENSNFEKVRVLTPSSPDGMCVRARVRGTCVKDPSFKSETWGTRHVIQEVLTQTLPRWAQV